RRRRGHRRARRPPARPESGGAAVTASAPASGRLTAADLARVASVGVRTRRLRAALSALGIAIGVAAIVAVLGLSASSQAGLLSEIDRLGTNLLTVQNGQTFTGAAAQLPLTAPAMISRLDGALQVAHTAVVDNANTYRTPYVPAIDTNAITVEAASLNLLPVAGTTIAQGTYLNAATAAQPVAVLGASAAARLGIDRIYPGERIWLGKQWFYLAGILAPAVLAPELDSSVLVGYQAAKRYLGYESLYRGKPAIGNPTTIYVRAATDRVTHVQQLLAYASNPH